MRYRLTELAEQQVAHILRTSMRHYGREAAERYKMLFLMTFDALAVDPERPGSASVLGKPSVRTYAVRHRRLQASPPNRIGRPRHIVVYRLSDDTTVEVLGVIHDRMSLPPSIDAALRSADGR